jgi:hypothetical protein
MIVVVVGAKTICDASQVVLTVTRLAAVPSEPGTSASVRDRAAKLIQAAVGVYPTLGVAGASMARTNSAYPVQKGATLQTLAPGILCSLQCRGDSPAQERSNWQQITLLSFRPNAIMQVNRWELPIS